MNLKALITSLVLGSSSLAMAQPTATFSADASFSFGYRTPAPTVIVRDHRMPTANEPCETTPVYQGYRPVVDQGPHNTRVGADISEYVGTQPFLSMRWFAKPAWIPLTEPTRIDSGREVIHVGTQAGALRSLRLQNTFGSSYIRMIGIEFVDGGRTQVVQVNRVINGNGSLTIDLDGRYRQVKRVIVYGSTAEGSAYQLLGG